MIAESGEIIVGSENFAYIKHTSLSAGLNVWAAGQLGVGNKLLRLIDLQSGHYVKPNVGIGTHLAGQLVLFSSEVLRRYCAHFNINCLDPNFDCIWG